MVYFSSSLTLIHSEQNYYNNVKCHYMIKPTKRDSKLSYLLLTLKSNTITKHDFNENKSLHMTTFEL